MTLKLLVFGRTGQVATELAALASDAVAVTCMGRDEADLADPDRCVAAVAETDADVVINAAAYTAVDRAEDDEAVAMAINGRAPGVIAKACAARTIPFLHVSTDYVFDGSGNRPWKENDVTAPLGVYGRSKLSGEQQVAAAGGPHVILRTAWVFSAHGSNFVKTMLRVGATRDRLTVVDDQRGGPTAAADIASTLVEIAHAFAEGRGVPGIFHYSGVPAVSWCTFAREIFARSSLKRRPEIVPIRTEDWPTRAKRPQNSVLDCGRIEAAYGIAQPDWRAALSLVLSDISRDSA